jgi:hypothetical protein
LCQRIARDNFCNTNSKLLFKIAAFPAISMQIRQCAQSCPVRIYKDLLRSCGDQQKTQKQTLLRNFTITHERAQIIARYPGDARCGMFAALWRGLERHKNKSCENFVFCFVAPSCDL